MLNEVMKFQSPFAIEDDGFIRVYQDSVMEYIVIVDVDGLKQFELKDLFKNINEIFDSIDLDSCNRDVYFEKNGRMKEYINKAIAMLVVKEEYERATEYIDKLSRCGSYEIKTENSTFYVACGKNGLFAFDKADIDDVTEQNGYIVPKIIETFNDYEKACQYVREHIEEYDPEHNF